MTIQETALAAFEKAEAERQRQESEQRANHRIWVVEKLKSQLKKVFGEELEFEIDTDASTATRDGLTFSLGRDVLLLMGECPDCHQQCNAEIWNLAALGAQLKEFKPDSHTHFQTPNVHMPIEEPSSDEKLGDALRAWLNEQRGIE